MTQEAENLIQSIIECGYPLADYNKDKKIFSIPECDEIAKRTGIKRTIILGDYYEY